MGIIVAGPADDPVVVGQYLSIRDSYGTPKGDYAADAADVIRRGEWRRHFAPAAGNGPGTCGFVPR